MLGDITLGCTDMIDNFLYSHLGVLQQAHDFQA